MQGAHQPVDSHSFSTFTSVLATSHSLFTPKRVGFTLAGAFVIAGAAITLQGDTAGHPAKSNPQNFTVQTSADGTASPTEDTPNQAAADTTNPEAASNTSSTNVQLNVNGQDVAIPRNGSMQTTVPTQDGGGNSSVSVQSSSNSSSSSLNVNISTDSSSSTSGFSSSNTVITQEGGTTFTSSN